MVPQALIYVFRTSPFFTPQFVVDRYNFCNTLLQEHYRKTLLNRVLI